MSERGMKKWAPYKSLIEQEKYLNKLRNDREKVDKPQISSDEAELINEILINYSGEELLITYWRSGKINTIPAILKKIDGENKKIVLQDRRTICFNEIIRLERVR